MAKFSVVKNGLVPCDDDAQAALFKLSIGTVVDVELLNSMNTKFNAKIFAAIGKLAKLSGVSTETMRVRLLILTGRFDIVPLNDHRKVLVAHSMSRSSMSNADRELFWDEMREVARDVILPELMLSAADMAEIDNLFGGNDDGRTNETQGTGTGNPDAPNGVSGSSPARVNEPSGSK